LDRLRHREVEPEDRLAAAQSARREAIENRSDAENRLRALPGPLFTAESLRLRQALVAAERARRAADHRRSLARLQDRALVRATFSGTVTRLERTPTADGHHLAVFYRQYGDG
jgi:hypothetical protein